MFDEARRRHPMLAFFSQRPITVGVVMMAVLVLGGVALKRTPIELMPGGIENRSIRVTIPYNDTNSQASPIVVEEEVTLPVEGELYTIAGLEELNCVTTGNESQFFLSFKRGEDMDEAWAQVMDALERARPKLSDDVGKFRVRRGGWGGGAGIPLGFVSFFWDDSAEDPEIKLEDVILPELESINGIASAEFFGGQRPYILIEIDQEKVRGRNVNIGDLLQNLRQENFRSPAGKVDTSSGEIYLVADSRLKSLDEIRSLPVRDGLTLGQIADVRETYSVSRYQRVNGRWGATAMLQMSGDANAVETSERTRETMNAMESDPRLKGFKTRIGWLQGDTITTSLDSLFETMLWGALFAMVVLTIFLKNVRIAATIAISIPVSLTMAVAVLYLMDETINMLVLIGFTIVAGMLLDNAIVVAENIFRRRQLGESPSVASVMGAGEVGLAMTLATSTTVIVFAVTAFMIEDDTMRMFMNKMGLAVSLSLCFSIVVAVLVIPMVMNKLALGGDGPKRAQRWFRGRRLALQQFARRGILFRVLVLPLFLVWEIAALFVGRAKRHGSNTPVIDWFSKMYSVVERPLIRGRYLVLPLIVIGTVIAITMVYDAQTRTDQNQGKRERIFISISYESTSELQFLDGDQEKLDRMWVDYALETERILWGSKSTPKGQVEDSELRAKAIEKYGIKDLSLSFNSSRLMVRATLYPDMIEQSDQLYKNIMRDIPKRAGAKVWGSFEGGANTEVSVLLRGPDTQRLMELGDEVVLRLSTVKGLEGLRVDTETGMDELRMDFDRERAEAFGIQADMLARIVAFNLSGTALNEYQRPDARLPLRVQFAPFTDAQGRPKDPDLSDVRELQVPGSNGSGVAAKAVTRSTGLTNPGLGSISRQDRQTTLKVVGTTSSDDMFRIRGEVQRALADVSLPTSYSYSLSGRFRDLERQDSEMMTSGLAVLLLVFLLMCFLFEDFFAPLSIALVSIPGAALGGMLLMWLTDTPLDGTGFLGGMMLVGLVVNNGIVMVDLIIRLRKQGMDRVEATLQACRQRMRPVLMTTFTTAFGLIPMAIGAASASGIPYYPIGRMVLGGLLLSMVYTLAFVPLLYLILDDLSVALKAWFRGIFGAKAPA